MQQTPVWSLSQEDPLEEEMATHSSILAWRSPWTEEPCGLQSMGRKELDTTKWLIMPLKDRITVKLMKLKTLQLHRSPSKVLEGILPVCVQGHTFL